LRLSDRGNKGERENRARQNKRTKPTNHIRLDAATRIVTPGRDLAAPLGTQDTGPKPS
jgi:hypothetical protein